MCGRFTQHLSWEEIHRLADLIGQPRNLQPRYNVAPTTRIEVIRPVAAGNELAPMRWGLVPSWWKKPLSELPSTFNARAEAVAEKPMFRSAFKARRCVIPASGFYEWTGPKGAKTPHYFRTPDGRPLVFAALWETWRDAESDAQFDSATIIVGTANNWMARFHNRMPVHSRLARRRRRMDGWGRSGHSAAAQRPTTPWERTVSPRVILTSATTTPR